MRKHLLFSLALLLAGPAFAANLDISVEIPRLDVAEYHRPYIAIWLEKSDQSHAADLAVWYDVKMADKKGEKWLKDLRQWWRKSGRNLELPVDGVSGATQAAGAHKLHYSSDKAPLKDLAPGNYFVVVEAAREVGERELLRVPFTWPVQQPAQQQAQGKQELGTVSIQLKP
ncbi:DUF2271 domain-containing protein [Azomonas macrocytogenes]|uniref:DUF2271 domain-containing protein n=1 Tax=Azomonas macrocytogenes TaxID=69962 RepID=A0A839T2W2_AZOMA|nr:DUF2271 domain-containing protein [Azomonas macrocytogenes]MBB3102053.1 hypothetical protein [Azomonas macrocytogenes]